MKNLARVRGELRPHGVLAPGCPACVWVEWCGGIEPEPTLYNTDCFAMNRTKRRRALCAGRPTNMKSR